MVAEVGGDVDEGAKLLNASPALPGAGRIGANPGTAHPGSVSGYGHSIEMLSNQVDMAKTTSEITWGTFLWKRDYFW